MRGCGDLSIKMPHGIQDMFFLKVNLDKRKLDSFKNGHNQLPALK
jgi:hypothetical protein